MLSIGSSQTWYPITTILTIALVARARCSTPASADEADAIDRRFSPTCQLLDDLYSHKDGILRANREVSAQGRTRTVYVHWDGRAPSRAAAALLATALRHARRYRRVALVHAADDICDLAKETHTNCHVLEYSETAYDKIVVSPAMAWSGSRCLWLEYCRGDAVYNDRWVAEPRLALESSGAAGVEGEALKLHAHLTESARADPTCARADSWTFYTDLERLRFCGFTQLDMLDSIAPLYIFTNRSEILDELRSRIDAYALLLNITLLELDAAPRIKFTSLLKERKSSFLFFDYDLWNGIDGVIAVGAPPPLDTTSPPTLDPTRSMRVADDFVLRQVAYPVLETLLQFKVLPADLREILWLETIYLNIEDAACAWAYNNTPKFNSYEVFSKHQRWIAVFLCSKDPDLDKYKTVTRTVEELYNKNPDFNIEVYFVNVDCTDENQLSNRYIQTFLTRKWQKLIGVVAAGLGMEMAAENAPGLETALVFYDVPGPSVHLGTFARATSGSVLHLAIAVEHFLGTFKWKRLALLTEDTKLAEGIRDALRERELYLHEVPATDISSSRLKDTLLTLREKNARVIFINTNAETAESIICEAHEHGMTAWSDYVWIVRERRVSELKCSNMSIQINHFTISFWWRGGNNTPPVGDRSNGTGYAIRKKLNELWKGSSWPPLASSLSDSLQLLIESFYEFCKKYPNKYFDLHGKGSTELLLTSLNNREVQYGVVQQLQYINGTFSSPLVFVDLWKNDQHETLSQWRIENYRVVPVTQSLQNIYDEAPPTDGASYCMTPTTGDPFLPICHDHVLLITLGTVLAAALTLYVARKVRLRHLARRDALLKAQLLARREFVANALVDHYVDRAALELHHDLGNGCFGRVRYGILRAPDCSPISVAVKEVRDDVSAAEENELLREACTIATLRHDHVVRLIGVCTTGRPLLVLMEYAFFGDLREYLRERRHLAQRLLAVDVDEKDEVQYISADSLTRLAKQAASALDYLSQEKLVHRDVRASNCLVDARRSLKLADFGLARKIEAGSSGEGEYSCQRRGLFPVLWMAPESLERGVFTPASDAWALGVLLLELVTLGERPYGAWSALRVLHYVLAGGRPPLPDDASDDTRHILSQCWRSIPDERLKAAELVGLLEASPAALRPSLRPGVDELVPAADSTQPHIV